MPDDEPTRINRGVSIGGALARGASDLRQRLVTAYGGTPRDLDRPDSRAVAAANNVSVRTAQRWIHNNALPARRPDVTARVDQDTRRALRTKAGRARATQGSAQRAAQRGVSVKVAGSQGIQPGRSYERNRVVNMHLDPETAAAMMQAYVEGGDRAALRYLADNSMQTYNVESWHFGRVTGFSINDLYQ